MKTVGLVRVRSMMRRTREAPRGADNTTFRQAVPKELKLRERH